MYSQGILSSRECQVFDSRDVFFNSAVSTETSDCDASLTNATNPTNKIVISDYKTEKQYFRPQKEKINKGENRIDIRIDRTGHLEFGGPIGVSLIMVIFPILMYYMWIGAEFYDGRFPTPATGQNFVAFLQHLGGLIYKHAFPTFYACKIFGTFLVFEAACYCLLPGVCSYGMPLSHEGGKRLSYHCSGMWSLVVTVIVMFLLHCSGIFKLYTLIDEFGSIMSVAICSSILISLIAYFSALYRGAEHRMTGHRTYDFFMGAELNPRLFGILDLKMFFEVRLPWFILFGLSCATAARQYEDYGYISAEVYFLVMAHFLYANACAKGEELITTTWDIFHEKWGFMLIFWNIAGVPLSYSHSTLYLANHLSDITEWPSRTFFLILLFTSYLIVYWIWDTANSQKNRFRAMEKGSLIVRKTFPQLPWQEIKNPRTIKTGTGDSILVDGWFRYARKIHYTCDFYFAITWALISGFNSPFPWFYPVFFACMIIHRTMRDVQRCRVKYGVSWTEYEKIVPWLYVPYVY